MARHQAVLVLPGVQVVLAVQVVAQPQIQQAAQEIPRQRLQAKEITAAYQRKHLTMAGQWRVVAVLVQLVVMALRKLEAMVALA
jgi:hypothetical protein